MVINFSSANCKNCYKCIRACPVKAIRMKDDQAEIDENKCITCGTCLITCPQNAKTTKSDIGKVKQLLANDKDIAVSLAPSFVGVFSFEHYSQIVSAIKKLGFSKVYQTSTGARLIANDYIKFYNDKTRSNLITTACPTVNYLVQKYYHKLVDCLIPVVSPMEAHGKYLKEIKGHSEVVFIGPCIAKKVEITDDYTNIDAVLTFEELKEWLSLEGIDPLLEDIDKSKNAFSDDANYYPLPGGSFKTIKPFIKDKWRDCIYVDGLENCKHLLNELAKGEFSNTWIEMNACNGSCSNGPAKGDVKYGFFKRIKRIKDFADKNSSKKSGNRSSQIAEKHKIDLDFTKSFSPIKIETKQPSEKEIRQILARIGKRTKEDELNCGACGYNTCKEKAIAVYNGMAETHMCMPYMRARAESMSNLIIGSTPNAIIAVDFNMIIQEYNQAAKDLFKIEELDLTHEPLSILIDDKDYYFVAKTKQNILNKKVYLKDYDIIVLQNIYYLEGHSLVIGIITDITAQEKIRRKSNELRRKTIDTTQNVIEKQMRVAQEIASVLGETTAETKVLLNKVRQLLLEETPGERHV